MRNDDRAAYDEADVEHLIDLALRAAGFVALDYMISYTIIAPKDQGSDQAHHFFVSHRYFAVIIDTGV
jgi:hypothetical protein